MSEEVAASLPALREALRERVDRLAECACRSPVGNFRRASVRHAVALADGRELTFYARLEVAGAAGGRRARSQSRG